MCCIFQCLECCLPQGSDLMLKLTRYDTVLKYYCGFKIINLNRQHMTDGRYVQRNTAAGKFIQTCICNRLNWKIQTGYYCHIFYSVKCTTMVGIGRMPNAEQNINFHIHNVNRKIILSKIGNVQVDKNKLHVISCNFSCMLGTKYATQECSLDVSFDTHNTNIPYSPLLFFSRIKPLFHSSNRICALSILADPLPHFLFRSLQVAI